MSESGREPVRTPARAPVFRRGALRWRGGTSLARVFDRGHVGLLVALAGREREGEEEGEGDEQARHGRGPVGREAVGVAANYDAAPGTRCAVPGAWWVGEGVSGGWSAEATLSGAGT